ncbi:hypothetical protein SAMN02910447_01493 [Ruminococcus sp. YE71]|uniref:DUF5685 family protein n=1 Tax=unclassified Ruminococcus TaxID=2608920 RepID=UPI00088890A3|nr:MULTISPECIES: DUF5685 family protein [unclassified Ruminococcus]SDA18672.1 hypothetical protein SAMN02910446_01481 [Ruminococcus sp. YE78]SFW29491.1 hypothetical protein SAMN02910447_01493 [Ruminococcus sp. YE71]
MFGYVKPYKPFLRVYENELYRAAYCGLCRELNRSFGFVPTLTLSYDLAFLVLADIGINSYRPEITHERCPVHPVRKAKCLKCSGSAFEYAACAQVILVYHKLRDDLHDKGLKHRLRALALIHRAGADYKKAAAKYPTLAQAVERAMERQWRTERKRSVSLDRAAEPTAAMMRAVFRELGRYDPDKRDLLGQFGYMLGRYVYICDALDDLNEDFASGSFDPLIPKAAYKLRRNSKILPKEQREKAAALAENSVMLTLGALAEVYVRLDLGGVKPMTDNIIYLGLRHTFDEVKKNALSGRKKNMKTGLKGYNNE